MKYVYFTFLSKVSLTVRVSFFREYDVVFQTIDGVTVGVAVGLPVGVAVGLPVGVAVSQ